MTKSIENPTKYKTEAETSNLIVATNNAKIVELENKTLAIRALIKNIALKENEAMIAVLEEFEKITSQNVEYKKSDIDDAIKAATLLRTALINPTLDNTRQLERHAQYMSRHKWLRRLCIGLIVVGALLAISAIPAGLLIAGGAVATIVYATLLGSGVVSCYSGLVINSTKKPYPNIVRNLKKSTNAIEKEFNLNPPPPKTPETYSSASSYGMYSSSSTSDGYSNSAPYDNPLPFPYLGITGQPY